MNAALRIHIPILVMAFLLASCSLNGKYLLHNATSNSIVFSMTSQVYDAKEYVVGARETGSLRFNFNINNEVSARSGEEKWCYKIKPLSDKWIATTISGQRIYAELSADMFIYVYPKELQQGTFFENTAPDQPDGYPLKPTRCE